MCVFWTEHSGTATALSRADGLLEAEKLHLFVMAWRCDGMGGGAGTGVGHKKLTNKLEQKVLR